MNVQRPELWVFMAAAAVPLALASCETTGSAGQCMPAVSAEADGTVKAFTLVRAREAWRDQVGSQYGQSYKRLDRARNKSESCNRSGKWYCGVTAEPCHK